MAEYTLTYDEKVKGWTSFYSYIPDMMVNMNNEFYSFKDGQLYIHNKTEGNRNTFYGQSYNTEIEFVANDGPSDVKIFKTIEIEGDSKEWDVTVATDLESGHVNKADFENKEGFKYSYIRRNAVDEVKTELLSVQGIGNLINIGDNPITTTTTSAPATTTTTTQAATTTTTTQATTTTTTTLAPGTVVIDGLTYNEVTNPVTGRTWLDRNLGATRVATSSSDSEAFGWLYQWGRLTDGHQLRDSGTTNIKSTTDVPGHGDFITTDSDWRNPANNNLWQGVNGINNPGINGYRLPTEQEWTDEIATWASNNGSGAYESILKLTFAKHKNLNTGGVEAATQGRYWSYTNTFGSPSTLYFTSSSALILNYSTGFGHSVRLIKDE